MFRFLTNDSFPAFSVYNFTIGTHFFDACTDFHSIANPSGSLDYVYFRICVSDTLLIYYDMLFDLW